MKAILRNDTIVIFSKKSNKIWGGVKGKLLKNYIKVIFSVLT